LNLLVSLKWSHLLFILFLINRSKLKLCLALDPLGTEWELRLAVLLKIHLLVLGPRGVVALGTRHVSYYVHLAVSSVDCGPIVLGVADILTLAEHSLALELETPIELEELEIP
jgi:hypothetical protein